MSEDRADLKRVCILALDALEYDLVEKFDLKGIKQVEYGKIDVTMFEELATPIIWASFITGQPPEKHCVNLKPVSRWKNPLLQRLREFFIKVKLNKIKRKGKIFKLFGFQEMSYHERIVKDFENHNSTTMFDIVPDAVALSVPPYRRWIDPETSSIMRQALENVEQVDYLEDHVWGVFERKKKRCLTLLREPQWNLFMVHFMFTDLLGHVFAGNLTKMFRVYAEAEKLVEEVSEIVGKETPLLIVSDHGMKPIGQGIYGDHSDHGFYSSNLQLGLRNPKITDFFDLILKILPVKSSSQEL